MSSEQEQVQVRFITQQPKYAVNDAPMLLPSNIQKEGLSEIVNSLLDLEKPIPFDFLIEGQLLRTSVVDYLNAARLSTENVITIEYVESMLPPVPLTAYEHDDWISSVHGHQGQLFLTGAYDNMVRLWNSMGECTATLTSHTDAVKSVSFGQVTDSTAQIFSGSLDQSVLGWSVDLNDHTHRVMYECKGHKGAIESISVDQSNRYLATASADSLVKIWTTEEPEEDEPSHETVNKKRKKLTTDERKLKTKAVTLEGHVGGVNAVVFDSGDSNVVFTGGWDHSIRSWDIEQQVNLTTKNCEKVVLDVDYSSKAKLLATGHSDHTVRLWDPRSEEGTNVKMNLRGHTAWVSSVSWSKKSEYTLCTGSYDSSIRVWDIRSREPLYTVESDSDDKVLSVYWENDQILSGGEDKKLHIYQAK